MVLPHSEANEPHRRDARMANEKRLGVVTLLHEGPEISAALDPAGFVNRGELI
jgi:hypothetical protein